MISEAVITGLLGTKTRLTCDVTGYMATYSCASSPIVVSVPKPLMVETGTIVEDVDLAGPHVTLAGDLIASVDADTLSALLDFTKTNAKMLKPHPHYPVGLHVGGGLPVIASDAQVAALSTIQLDEDTPMRFLIPTSIATTLWAFADDGPLEIRRAGDLLTLCSKRLRVSAPWIEFPAVTLPWDQPGITMPRADLKRLVKAAGKQQPWSLGVDGTVTIGDDTLSGTPDAGFTGCEFLCDAVDINRVLLASKTPSLRVFHVPKRAIILTDESGTWAVAPRRYLSVT